MRTFEVIIGLLAAVIVFAVLKVIGLILKFAIVAALLGFIAGLVIARMFRSKS